LTSVVLEFDVITGLASIKFSGSRRIFGLRLTRNTQKYTADDYLQIVNKDVCGNHSNFSSIFMCFRDIAAYVLHRVTTFQTT